MEASFHRVIAATVKHDQLFGTKWTAIALQDTDGIEHQITLFSATRDHVQIVTAPQPEG